MTSTKLERHKAGYVAIRLIHKCGNQPGELHTMNLWCEHAEEYRLLCEAVLGEWEGFKGKYYTLSYELNILSIEKKVVE